MKENADQSALRAWIQAGLRIPEVRELNGDAKYIFNNMIAKYTLAAEAYRLSVRAEHALESQGCNLNAVHVRSSLYGKDKRTLFEHAIPAAVVRRRLLMTKGKPKEVQEVLRRAGPVVILLRGEDRLLKKRFNSKMPEAWGWGGDELARYREVGIRLSRRSLRVKGAIKR